MSDNQRPREIQEESTLDNFKKKERIERIINMAFLLYCKVSGYDKLSFWQFMSVRSAFLAGYKACLIGNIAYCNIPTEVSGGIQGLNEVTTFGLTNLQEMDKNIINIGENQLPLEMRDEKFEEDYQKFLKELKERNIEI